MLRPTLAFTIIILSYLAPPTFIILAAWIGAPLPAMARYWMLGIGVLSLAILVPLRLGALQVARRLLSGSAGRILERTSEGLTLYLRSFQEDDPTPEDTSGALGKFFRLWQAPFASRPEERLVVVANGLGPLVALGRPGERLPQVGAARLYVSHREKDHWQSVVGNLCARAELVIIQVSVLTSGLRWEILNVPQLISPEKLVLYFPGSSATKNDSRDAEFSKFRESYPLFYGRALPAMLADARCIIFDREGNPQAISPWSLPIRSNLSVLNDDYGIFLKSAEIGVDDDSLCLVSAIERNFPNYNVPAEADLPFDLRVYRAFAISLGPASTLLAILGLSALAWPGWYGRFSARLAQFL